MFVGYDSLPLCHSLYRSPHLVEVRERIRINGRPLSKEVFTRYYWSCYKKLKDDWVYCVCACVCVCVCACVRVRACVYVCIYVCMS